MSLSRSDPSRLLALQPEGMVQRDTHTLAVRLEIALERVEARLQWMETRIATLEAYSLGDVDLRTCRANIRKLLAEVEHG